MKGVFMKTASKKIAGFIVVGLVLFAAGFASAACSSTVCTGKIERLYTNAQGTLYIATDGNEQALNCTAPAGKYISMPATDENFDRKYALLLTALSLDKPVGLRIVTGSSDCALSYIFMDN